MFIRNNLYPLDLPKAKEHSLATPEDVADLLIKELRYAPQEEFWCLCLSTKNTIIAMDMITKGTLNRVIVHPRDIYRFAIMNNAASIIIAHNHPSGDPAPSQEDDAATKTMVDSGKILKIPCVDHIIIGDNEYFSYHEEGKLND